MEYGCEGSLIASFWYGQNGLHLERGAGTCRLRPVVQQECVVCMLKCCDVCPLASFAVALGFENLCAPSPEGQFFLFFFSFHFSGVLLGVEWR